MKGQRSAHALMLILLLARGTSAASLPIEECAPPHPGALSPVAVPAPDLSTRISTIPGRAPEGGLLAVPAVAIRVRAPAEAGPGQELSYRLSVENCSKAAAHHVTVRVTLAAAIASFVRATPEPTETEPVYVWKLGTLASCARREITLVVKPTGDAEVSCCARVAFEHGQCVRTRIGKGFAPAPTTAPPPPPPPPTKPERTPPLTPSVPPSAPPPPPTTPASEATAELQIRKSGPTEAPRYDIFTYKLEVRNVGRGKARKVVLRDTLPRGITFLNSKPAEASQSPLQWNLGDLAPGGSQTIEYEVVAKETGTLTNTASVEAEGVARKEVQHTVRVGQPGLHVIKTGPKTRDVGRKTTYHLTVTNPGDLPATGVHLADDLTADMEFVGATAGGKQEGSQVRWSLGTLAAGARRTVQVTVRARRAGVFKNVCTATADRGLTEQGRAETNFVSPSGLAVEIDPENDSVELDRVTQFVVRVHNAGKLVENDVVATIIVPDGLKILDLPGVTGHVVKGGIVVLPKRSLKPGEEAHVIVRVQGSKAGPTKVAVEVHSERVPADKALKGDDTILVLPTATTSRKTSSW